MKVKEILNLKYDVTLIQKYINQEFTAKEVQKMIIFEQIIKGNPTKLAESFILKEKCNSNFHDPHIRKQHTKVETCSVCGEV